jgi:tetratricopeptide (TPR) repeat protein
VSPSANTATNLGKARIDGESTLLPWRRAPHYDGAVIRPIAASTSVAWALCLCTSVTSAWAQSPAPGDPEPPEDPIAAEAQTRYQRGRALYQEGRYHEAVTELESALALDPDEPVLLYNLALVYEKLDSFDEAIGYLRRYRDTGLPDDERDRVEATIRRLEGAREHVRPQQPTERVVHVPVRVEVERRPREPGFGRADAVFFVATAVAGAALVTTIVTGAMALSEETEVDRFVVGESGDLEDREVHVLNANDLAFASDVALVVTGVAAVSATLLFALRRGDPDEAPAEPAGPMPGLSVGPTGAMATVQGRF